MRGRSVRKHDIIAGHCWKSEYFVTQLFIITCGIKSHLVRCDAIRFHSGNHRTRFDHHKTLKWEKHRKTNPIRKNSHREAQSRPQALNCCYRFDHHKTKKEEEGPRKSQENPPPGSSKSPAGVTLLLLERVKQKTTICRHDARTKQSYRSKIYLRKCWLSLDEIIPTNYPENSRIS